jgi:aldose 1-epimerase
MMADWPSTGSFLLQHGVQRAVVCESGATLRSWSVDGHEVLDGAAAFGGRVLAPWPNRLRDGRYTFADQDLVLPLTEPERRNAMHGLVAWTTWTCLERTHATLALGYRLHPQPGYPFCLDLSVIYALTGDGLDVTVAALNAGTAAAPFGAGFHPYLVADPVDGAELELPVRVELGVDDRMLPDGRRSPATSVRALRPVAGTVLDTCFTDLDRDADGLARARLVPPSGPPVTLWMDGAWGFLQAYTADADPDPGRRRRSVALEPMTCAPDAFASGDGLVVLEPGAAFRGRFGFKAG